MKPSLRIDVQQRGEWEGRDRGRGWDKREQYTLSSSLFTISQVSNSINGQQPSLDSALVHVCVPPLPAGAHS